MSKAIYPIAACLKQVPLFQELSQDECMDIVRAFSMQSVKAGQAPRLREANARFMELFSRPRETIDELQQRLVELQGDLEGGPSEHQKLLEYVGYRG